MATSGQAAPSSNQTVRQIVIQKETPKQEINSNQNQTSFAANEVAPKEELSPSFATMTQMFDDKSPAQRPNPQASIPETQYTEAEDNSNTNPLMNPFMQYDDSNGASDENFQEDIPDEEEDNQEDDLGFDIF